ncbi:MAG: hypothetical protein KGZ59_06005 [Chitinophagaceae bacterium]|nr:hypothetical protein [Chitinophagaceae bacterium]
MKILYVDMDNVLVNFQSGIDQLSPEIIAQYEAKLDEVPGIFSLMKPIEGAIEAYKLLSEKFDTYILSTSPWENPTAASDKFAWVKKYLGKHAYKRLILTHHKNLNYGDYLIDDRPNNGASQFEGKFIQFRKEPFENWNSVIEYLLKTEK